MPLFFKTAASFGEWLEKWGAQEPELVVGFYKVATGKPNMSWPESVDEALCHGWIDGVRKRIDEHSYQIRFTPRRPSSIWSKINIAKVEALSAASRLRPAGTAAYLLRKMEKSAVYAYEQPSAPLLAPADVHAFKKNQRAWQYFQTTPPGYRKVVVHWVTAAKQESTRLRRLTRLISACALGQRMP